MSWIIVLKKKNKWTNNSKGWRSTFVNIMTDTIESELIILCSRLYDQFLLWNYPYAIILCYNKEKFNFSLDVWPSSPSSGYFMCNFLRLFFELSIQLFYIQFLFSRFYDCFFCCYCCYNNFLDVFDYLFFKLHPHNPQCWWILFLLFLFHRVCQSVYYYYYYYSLRVFHTSISLWVFYWSQSDSKFLKVFRILLSIRANYYYYWRIVLTRDGIWWFEWQQVCSWFQDSY